MMLQPSWDIPPEAQMSCATFPGLLPDPICPTIWQGHDTSSPNRCCAGASRGLLPHDGATYASVVSTGSWTRSISMAHSFPSLITQRSECPILAGHGWLL